MNRIRRSLLLAPAAALVARPAPAQEYPSRPIRVIVPYAPGGTDQQLRILAPALQRILGQSLVIENIAGGGTIIGAGTVHKANPDGYTLLYTGTGAMTVIPNMAKTPYSRADFLPLGNVIGTPFVVAVRPDAPFRTLAEFVAYGRANPGKISFGSAGIGTTTHMAGEAIAAAGNFKILHVPYQGIGPAVTSILGGNVDMVVGLPNAIMPHVNAGKLVALAITGPQRSDLMPSFMTVREGGLDMVDVTKFGFFAPRGTPEAVVRRWVAAIPEAMKAPDFVEATRRSFNSTMYLDPEQFRGVLDAEDRHFKKLIADLKLGDAAK
ncbi:MAG: tripartite tricarboxylate transporter substrate binding protein [Burkholderiales bacterium]|nr:tripartite tricarboxylate transporter substrate binding protein [Burkholderiales bacterium]